MDEYFCSSKGQEWPEASDVLVVEDGNFCNLVGVRQEGEGWVTDDAEIVENWWRR